MFDDEEKDRTPSEENMQEKQVISLKEFQTSYYDWLHAVKLLVAELKNERRSSPSKSRHRSGQGFNQGDLNMLEEDEENPIEEKYEEQQQQKQEESNLVNDAEEQNDGEQNLTDETEATLDQHDSSDHLDSSALMTSDSNIEVAAKIKNSSQMNNNENHANNEDVIENNQNNEMFMSLVSFEIIGPDTNTERKFLENLNLENENHLTEAELKASVFNAKKTIESLQNDLM